MMQQVIKVDLPYVVFFGDIREEIFGKTGLGVVQWRREGCLGQVGMPGCQVDAGIRDLTIPEAAAAGARSLIVGSAAVGGIIPESWVAVLQQAAECGIDIVAGLHIRLATLPGLARAAKLGRARLVDARIPPAQLPVGTGRKRAGRRLLTVGTDCACGKKYTALALDVELRRRGVRSDFRATGQTGIMIAGQGIPIDAVVSDFVTGAAEVLAPDNDADHWDIIEGQGALFHPGYLQVTVGLLIGSQPDAIVVCHDALRETVAGWPEFRLLTIQQVIDRAIELGRLTSPDIRCVGVAVNSSKLHPDDRQHVLEHLGGETGLPCVDPLVEGVGPIVDRLLRDFCPA